MTKRPSLALIIAMSCIVLIFTLVLAQILLRLLNIQIPSVEDFAGYLLITSCFLGLAYTFEEQGHIRVTLLLHTQHPRLNVIINYLSHIAALLISAFVVYACWQLVSDSYHFHELTTGQIPLPQWPLQLPMLVGSALLLCSIFKAILLLGKKHG
ncbi:hypothetical protein PULV_a3306 [Pseudoalteromonas ulvae UL12]|uniref:TRAP transporter small permease protein n=1 Tax=Pseudoalteromonas ulvae TaxID=107327 RepID=A0A244CPP0_PSEDV|nr:TRAP transporter small permease [Pseudoalteromonas ulvae]MBE0365006.1 hypothetical protein [Pseudoalteromonas ulvae UL12]OUL57565.1 hypothetical protein B1199_10875 [Pseudoalteromonas ulvae]